MKIFISSVRRSLEAERDSLPGLILGLGHTPARFEDYTAQPVPSREACLRGVEDADAYLLLLGEHYGEPLPDTGLSPTEEEWNQARARGIPILVFRKRGVEPDNRQSAFIEEVEAYIGGRFRKAFEDMPTLLAEAGVAIRTIAEGPEPLVWERLDPSLISQRRIDACERAPSSTHRTVLALHLLPVQPADRISATLLGQLNQRLLRDARKAGLFSEAEAAETLLTSEEVAVQTGEGGVVRGIGVDRDRNLAVWETLEVDSLGSIVDPSDLAIRIEKMLRLVAPLALLNSSRVAIEAKLSGVRMATLDDIAELGHRSSASLMFSIVANDAVSAVAEDSVPTDAQDHGGGEIGSEIAQRLILQLRSAAGF